MLVRKNVKGTTLQKASSNAKSTNTMKCSHQEVLMDAGGLCARSDVLQTRVGTKVCVLMRHCDFGFCRAV